MSVKKGSSEMVRYVTDWVRLGDVRGPTVGKNESLVSDYGIEGCYQAIHKNDLADDIPLIDKRIGYTGKGANVFSRIMMMRQGRHSNSAYQRKNFENPHEEVYVRYIFPIEEVKYSRLEKVLQDETHAKTGLRMAWEAGTSSAEGKMYRAYDAIDNLTTIEQLREIAKYVQEKATEIFASNWLDSE